MCKSYAMRERDSGGSQILAYNVLFPVYNDRLVGVIAYADQEFIGRGERDD